VAFTAILQGNIYIPPIEYGDVPRHEPPSMRLPATLPLEALALSPRQVDTLGLLITGVPNKTIARRLGIAEGTVKSHVSAVLGRLGARNRTEALLVVNQIGWGRITERYGHPRHVSSRGSDDAADRPASVHR
jgi:DNA-binding NarL/FixJ family response regulator